MDLKKAKITLDKINSLYQSMSIEEGNVSNIERDLMLSYIQQLYDAFLHQLGSSTEVTAVATTSKTNIEKPKPKRTYKPPRIIEIPDSLQNLQQEKPAPKPEIPKPTDTPPPTAPDPQPEPVAQQPASGISGDDGAFAALFEFKEAKELSEKLSARPIQDLTKALAINDRLLYMNELFSKDLNSLNDALSQLNRYDRMREAKPLLINLAEKYDWMEESRINIAKDFVRLVRRKYS
jgi:hypothetical protein